MTARYYSSEPKCGSVAVADEELNPAATQDDGEALLGRRRGMAELPKNNF